MYRIGMISNIYFEPYLRSACEEAFAISDEKAEITFIPYEDLQTSMASVDTEDMILCCLNFYDWYPGAESALILGELTKEEILDDAIFRCLSVYDGIRRCTSAPILWVGFEDLESKGVNVCGNVFPMDGLVDEINLEIHRRLKDVTFLDLKRVIAQVGIEASFQLKGKYRWNTPYSKQLVRALMQEVHKQYRILLGKTFKCLVLDCDNVLWGGILSDDGMDKILLGNEGLGRQFYEFQRFVRFLYEHGVILAICSKNRKEDVLEVFRDHKGMLLKEEDIADMQCNFEPKPENILSIANNLNISTSSMVFVDDSPFEIEAVKAMLPEVKTILYTRDSIFEQLGCFHLREKPDLTSHKIRMETYQSNGKRRELEKMSQSFEEYIASLNMVVDIHPTLDSEYARCAELSQRTNKCTNGQRYSMDQMKKKADTEAVLWYTVSLSDRFSDLGIVGIMGLAGETLDLFSLSCRALGRNVEEQMMDFVRNHGITQIKFLQTPKNEWMKELIHSRKLIQM